LPSRAAVDGTELLDAWAELDLLRAKTLEEMRGHPVLLCPVASIPAFRHGERSGHRGADGGVSGRGAAHAVVQRAGRAGSGGSRWRSPEGLPIGVQIVARPFEDETALGVAAIVDAAFGYKPPPMARG
jgi:amidase